MMKTKLFAIALFAVFNFSYSSAQNSENNCPPLYTRSEVKTPKITITKIEVLDSNKFTILPQFVPDKDSVAELIFYPEIAKRAGVQGYVVVKINLDTNGIVTKGKLIKGIGAGCDEAALDVLLKSKFYPAKIENLNSNSELIFEILFDLNLYIDKPAIELNEIRFDLDGNLPYHKQTIIFNSDGTAYFQENYGYKESEKNLKGYIYKSGFTRLNDFIISQCFLDYQNEYISQSPSDFPTIKVIVQNDEITKSVTAKGEGYAPVGFWAIKNLIRYIKDQINWEEVQE